MSEKLLYVALDHNTRSENLYLAQELDQVDANYGTFGFKINQDHVLRWNEDYIRQLSVYGRPIFADLKMNNGARTMSNTIKWLADLGVTHTNVWAHADSNLAKTMDQVSDVEHRPSVLGVTFYTRWTEDYAQKHHRMSLPEVVSHWSHVAVDSGADGIIVPGNLLHTVSDLDTVKLNTAVRIAGAETSSKQEQVSTPYDAVMAGSDILVVGSPVYESRQPATALKQYLAEMLLAEAELTGKKV